MPVYPGSLSSIRFERLRGGIQDYEKIRILKDLLAPELSIIAVQMQSLGGAIDKRTGRVVLAARDPW